MPNFKFQVVVLQTLFCIIFFTNYWLFLVIEQCGKNVEDIILAGKDWT